MLNRRTKNDFICVQNTLYVDPQQTRGGLAEGLKDILHELSLGQSEIVVLKTF